MSNAEGDQGIELHIEAPSHIQPFVGSDEVEFRGRVTLPSWHGPPPRLYYRWYSSLDPAVREGRYAFTQPALDAPAPSPALKQLMPLGSQIITFAVSDQATESDDAFKAMQHGAATGGALGAQACEIHVFRATILVPGDGQTLSAAGLALKAQAPWAWQSASYQSTNRLAYRWSILPDGASPGRPSFVSPKLGPGELRFNDADQSVSYKPALPSGPQDPALVGPYHIKLEVLDSSQPEIGNHSATIAVVFV